MKCSRYLALSLLLFFLLLITGCSKSNLPVDIGEIGTNIIGNNEHLTPESTEKGSWDNSPKVLTPSADGTSVYNCDAATIDASHITDGYIMVNYFGSNEKVKLQITGPDGVTYTYDLHGDYEVFPLTAGNGSYNVGVFENISGTQYAGILSTDIDVSIDNVFGPYLYPNQYVNFSNAPLTIAKGSELAYTCSSDIEVVEKIYDYIIASFSYDYDKAANVESGYLPNVDEIFSINTGICFDYASVMATMLRSQSIPTRLEVGYIGEEYHAWISTYIEDVGWINGIIEFDGSSWNLMDPTFASTSKSPQSFISENSKYITKYVY